MAEKYSFQSPYAYAANNPVSFIDYNGEGPWEFLKGLGSSITAAITIGFQAGIDVKAAGRPGISIYGNGGSKDLIGVRDGSVTHIAQEDSPTRFGHSIGFGGFGTSAEAEIVKSTETGMLPPYPGTDSEVPYQVGVEKGTKTVTASFSGFAVETTETAEIRTNHRTGTQETNTTNPKVSTVSVDISPKLNIKASAILGIDVSFDLGKVLKAFDELNK